MEHGIVSQKKFLQALKIVAETCGASFEEAFAEPSATDPVIKKMAKLFDLTPNEGLAVVRRELMRRHEKQNRSV